eukprot:m.165366 g.165366  ORF g.165366 m.165366 type:complete len:230 (+) comp23995_c0_seq2:297-986(+)
MSMQVDGAGPAIDESQVSQMTDGTQGMSLFSARLDDVQSMSSILKTVSFVQEATCEISKAGLKFIVEHHKSLEAKAFFQASLFHSFYYADGDDTTSFSVNLGVLLECLSIFGSSVSATLKMSYAGYGSPLVLLLEDGGIVTDCSIRTSEPGELLGIDIRQTEIPGNIIMKSHWLAEVCVSPTPSSYSLNRATSRILRFQQPPICTASFSLPVSSWRRCINHGLTLSIRS